MVSFQHWACLLLLARAIGAALGAERCHGAGSGVCTNADNRATPSEATGSMLQVKDMQGQIKSDLAHLANDLADSVNEFQNQSPEEVDKIKKAAAISAGKQIVNAKQQGIAVLKGLSDRLVEKIDEKAHGMEDGLFKASEGMKDYRKSTEVAMKTRQANADQAIDDTVQSVYDAVTALTSGNPKLEKDVKVVLDQVVVPPAKVAKASIKAQMQEVDDVLGELSVQPGDLGLEVEGVVGQFKDEAKQSIDARLGINQQ